MIRRALLFFGVLVAVVAGATSPATAALDDPSAPGQYAVGYTDATVRASGRSFSARIYYPATSAGSNKPVATGQFGAIAFGHGFLQANSKYAGTMSHLASWGFIVAAPNTNTGFNANHSAFADDLNASLTWLVAQDTTAGSRFNGKVNEAALGLSGHSMGGGASILAASRNPAVKTVANLAAAETNPSAAAAAANVRVPVQFIAGDKDTIAPVDQHTRKIYNGKASAKQLRTIRGGSHCGFMDSSGLFCDNGTISRTVQLQITRRLLTTWFLYHLNGDTSREDQVWGGPAQNDPQVAFEGVR